MGDLPEGVTHWDGPGLDAWEAWTPDEIAHRLAGVDVPWCVVGGWAIDVWLGEQSREHEDLEIATQRAHLGAMRQALAGTAFHSVGDGQVFRLEPDEETKVEHHQNWALDVSAQRWRVDVMLEPGDAETWVYRRDERLSAPRAFMVATSDAGVPYLRPHGALLYKAKNMRPKDQADFTTCLPRLDATERAWLLDALAHQHPVHPWCALLRSNLRG